ncbi:isochorismatase family protein isoform X2 [Wolffia australiana]
MPFDHRISFISSHSLSLDRSVDRVFLRLRHCRPLIPSDARLELIFHHELNKLIPSENCRSTHMESDGDNLPSCTGQNSSESSDNLPKLPAPPTPTTAGGSVRTPRSKILQHFTKIETNKYACKICRGSNPIKEVILTRNRDSSTTVFWRHIQSRHRKLHDEIKGELKGTRTSQRSVPDVPDKGGRDRNVLAIAAVPSRWKETAMLVIDMQKDFIRFGSPVQVKGGEAIIPAVIRAVGVARERGIHIVWVVREHDPQGRDVELFRRHMYGDGTGPTVKGSAGAELAAGLEVKEGDYKLIKTRFSAFFGTHLHSLLTASNIRRLVVVGVQTPNCIRQTVFDAVALDYPQITVISDATAAATPEVHHANILDIKNVGVATPTLEEWCAGHV